MLSPVTAYALFSACLLLYGLAYHYDLTSRSVYWLRFITAGESYHLGFSTSVIGDTLLALIVTASIVALPSLAAINQMLAHGRWRARMAASRTLSLCLFHMPLFAILYGWVGLGKGGAGGAVLCLVLGLGAAVLLGGITEARVGMWRRGLQWVYTLARNPRPP